MKDLSSREQQVYNLIISEGLTVQQMANRLYLSVGTVKRVLRDIYLKKQVSSKLELTIKHYKELQNDFKTNQ